MRRRRSGLAPRDRGQSVSINYTLSLVIISVMMAGLFISMGNFLDDERERVTRSELSVLGNRIAADIATADRLARTADDGVVEVRTTIPPAVAGVAYEVEITSSQFASSSYWDVDVVLRGPEVGVTQTVSVRTAHEVEESRLNGGAYVVHYHGNSDKMEVHDE